MALESILIIPDCHIPYHSERAWNLLLKAARQLKPKHIAILGDFVDFYQVSSHSKDPSRAMSTEDEIKAGNRCLDQLDALGAKNKLYIEGNHEDRMNRYLMEKAPEIKSMIRVEELLKLKQRKWKFTPYKHHAKIGKLHLTHDTGTAGPTAHKTSLHTFQDNVVIGHTHRIAYCVEGNAKGKPHVGAMFGWLGDVKQVDYMHRIKADRDWAMGFGTGYLDTSNGFVYIQPIPLVNFTCVLNGKLLKG
jgi:predicted phosphodiesterase